MSVYRTIGPLVYVIDEMSCCFKPQFGQKLVASGHIREVLA